MTDNTPPPANTTKQQRRRKKRRWGDAPPPNTTASTTESTPTPTTTTTTTTNNNPTRQDARAKAAALTQSIAARLAAIKAAKLSSNKLSSTTTTIKTAAVNVVEAAAAVAAPARKKAKVYNLDMSDTKPTFLRRAEKLKPVVKKNPYLDHLEPPPQQEQQQKQTEDDTENNNLLDKKRPSPPTNNNKKEEMLLDNRLAGGTVVKQRRRHRPLTFVEPGTYIEIGEKRRAKADKLAKSGFASGRKVGTYAKSTGMARIVEDDSIVAGSSGMGEKNDSTDYYGGDGLGGEGGGVGDGGKKEYVLAPRADALEEAAGGGTAGSGGVVVIPLPLVMEWWDVELLPNKLKKEVVGREGKALTSLAKKRLNMVGGPSTTTTDTTNNNDKDSERQQQQQQHKEQTLTKNLIQKCFITASITNSRTHTLIQHPIPILPPHALQNKNSTTTATPTLHLTKREMKRQRKLRRAARQEELQSNQMAGLVPAPEPRLTISNFVRVLGSQAVLDPSKMEAIVMKQIRARKTKHEAMNAARKLTKEQKGAKRDRMMEKDTNSAGGVVEVALFVVKDMGHRYHRTKVDLNAQQRGITGGVLECEETGMSLVICEGGPKAVKAYRRLMLVRMKWKGENFLDEMVESDNEVMEEVVEEGDDAGGKSAVQKFNANNTCELVWTGMAPKRMFNSFVFQSCATSEMARKVLEAKGVAHFWDQVLVHASGSGEKFNFKLGDES